MARYFSTSFVKTGLAAVGSQLSLWLAVLRSPLTEIMRDDPGSEESRGRAYRFYLFVFTVVFLLRAPYFDIFLGIDMRSPLNLLALFVLNAVSIAVFVLILYVCAKVLFGRGRLRASTVAGIYLTAFWPFLMLMSYLSGISLHMRAAAGRRISEWWFVEPVTYFATIALLLLLFFFLIIKSLPAIKYVHRIGNIRAIILCGFCYVLAFELQNWLVLELLSEFMRLTG
ncbi:MAG TPA: hypothetical protein VF268_14025 [Gammaproteobacteria bacterium]